MALEKEILQDSGFKPKYWKIIGHNSNTEHQTFEIILQAWKTKTHKENGGGPVPGTKFTLNLTKEQYQEYVIPENDKLAGTLYEIAKQIDPRFENANHV